MTEAMLTNMLPSFAPPKTNESQTDLLVMSPTFHREEYFRQALCSVFVQQNATVTVIVVDDNPKQSAENVVRRFTYQREIYLNNHVATGGNPGIVRNQRMSHTQEKRTRGDVVYLLDDDDIVPEGLYRALKNAFLGRRNTGVVFGCVEPFGDPPKASQLAQGQRFFADAAHRADALPDCTKVANPDAQACSQAILADNPDDVSSFSARLQLGVRKECLLNEVSGVDQNILLWEDSEFYARAIRRCGALFLGRLTVRFRISGYSLMHTTNVTASAREKEELKVNDGMKRKGANLREQLKQIPVRLQHSLHA